MKFCVFGAGAVGAWWRHGGRNVKRLPHNAGGGADRHTAIGRRRGGKTVDRHHHLYQQRNNSSPRRQTAPVDTER